MKNATNFFLVIDNLTDIGKYISKLRKNMNLIQKSQSSSTSTCELKYSLSDILPNLIVSPLFCHKRGP